MFALNEGVFVFYISMFHTFVKRDTIQDRKVKTGLLLNYLQNKQFHLKQPLLGHP